MELILVRDGSEIDENILNRVNIPKDLVININQKVLSNFVGLLVISNFRILSIPKKMKIENFKDFRSLEKYILSVITKFYNTLSISSNLKDELENVVPVDAILNIIDYYRLFGIYKSIENHAKKNNGKRISWNKTIIKSSKLISRNNLIFNDFYYFDSTEVENFISDSMKFVINFAQNDMQSLISFEPIITNSIDLAKFSDSNLVVLRLMNLRSQIYNDRHRSLLNDLINFFSYLGRFKNELRHLTKSFDYIWESAVHQYLNINFHLIDEVLDININEEIKFERQKKFNIGIGKNGPKNIIVDHYFKNNNKHIIFDSKYYRNLTDIDYKQLSYHYLILAEEPLETTNTLVVPAESDKIEFFVHLDRRDIDGVVINELHIPVLDVLNSFLL